MKKIGLIGGMSWESTVTYYQVINETVKSVLGGLHSADMIIRSLDLFEIEKHQSLGEWDKVAEKLKQAVLELEREDADFIVIASNTVHKVVSEIQNYTRLPILHIADAAADAMKDDGVFKAGLLGTKYTMTQDFMKAKLLDDGIEVIVPDNEMIEKINAIIFDEACVGIISDDSKETIIDAIKELKAEGAQGVLLGCTELGLLIKQDESLLPLYDTAVIHAEKAAEYALK